MTNKPLTLFVASYLALSTELASAQSITLNYDYMATNKAGSFNGRSSSVATLKLTDFAAGTTYLDAAGITQSNTDSGYAQNLR